MTDFIFLDYKITVDGDCSHKIERHLPFFGRKAMANLNSILNTRDITLPAKVHVVKAMVFWVVMYRYELDHKEGWAPKNWCFWIVVLKKTLKGILDSIEIKPVHPKGNQPWICTVRIGAETNTVLVSIQNTVLCWSSNTLATWCKGPTHWKRPWCWERLRAGGEGSSRGWDGWMTSQTQWTRVWANSRR